MEDGRAILEHFLNSEGQIETFSVWRAALRFLHTLESQTDINSELSGTYVVAGAGILYSLIEKGLDFHY